MEENRVVATIAVPLPRAGEDAPVIANQSFEDDLIEVIWKELKGRADREQVRQAVLEAEARYEDASIKTYVPVFVRRYVLDRLRWLAPFDEADA